MVGVPGCDNSAATAIGVNLGELRDVSGKKGAGLAGVQRGEFRFLNANNSGEDSRQIVTNNRTLVFVSKAARVPGRDEQVSEFRANHYNKGHQVCKQGKTGRDAANTAAPFC